MSLTVKPRALTWWHWIFYEQKASLALWIVTFMIPINIKEMSYERLWRTCKWMSEEALTTAAFSCFKLSTKCLVWCQVSCSTDMSTIFPTSFNNKHWVKPSDGESVVREGYQRQLQLYLIGVWLCLDDY